MKMFGNICVLFLIVLTSGVSAAADSGIRGEVL
jgi:hypothetical protein